VDTLARVAAELSIPDRTLRRAVSEGLVRGERVSPRRFQISLREEAYLRSHWASLHALRATLRTERNVRLAVLFGSFADGVDDACPDADLLVASRDPDVQRLADLAGRLSRAVLRDVHLVTLSEAELAPAVMLEVLEQGRVLVDREGLWRKMTDGVGRWRRLTRRAERDAAVALDTAPEDWL
jgi:predicted nucleotidyltransferase